LKRDFAVAALALPEALMTLATHTATECRGYNH